VPEVTPSAWSVAFTVMFCVVETVDGAVYKPAEVTLPIPPGTSHVNVPALQFPPRALASFCRETHKSLLHSDLGLS
jgi:hypothetical protein